MSWYSIFYLFSIADGLLFVATLFLFVSIIVAIVTSIINFPADNSYDRMEESSIKLNRKLMFLSWTMVVITTFMVVLIPDRKDMLMIIAGGAVGEFVTNDENAKELPSDVVRFLRKEILEATLEEGNDAIKESLGIESEKDKLMKKSKEELIKMLEEKIE